MTILVRNVEYQSYPNVISNNKLTLQKWIFIMIQPDFTSKFISKTVQINTQPSSLWQSASLEFFHFYWHSSQILLEKREDF